MANFVILASGQSNEELILPYSWSPPTNLKMWDVNGTNLGIDGAVGSAFVPVPSTSINMAWKLGAVIAEARPNDNIYVIQISFGGQRITHWLPGTSAPDVFANILANVPLALSAIGETKIDLFDWDQGEADAIPDSFLNALRSNLEQVIARFQTQSWFPKATPIIIHSVVPGSVSGVPQYDQVNTILGQVAAEQPELRMFVYSGMISSPPGVHQDANGINIIGEMTGRSYLEGPKRADIQGYGVDYATGYGGRIGIGRPIPTDWRLSVAGGQNGGANYGDLVMGNSGGYFPAIGYNYILSDSSNTYTYAFNTVSAQIIFEWGNIQMRTAGAGTRGNGIFYVQGPYLPNGGTAWVTPSLRSLKEDIEPASVLDRVKKVRLASYKYRDTGSLSIGFIQDEFEKVFPELTDKGGINYGGAGAVALGAANELASQLEELKAEIAELKAQIKH